MYLEHSYQMKELQVAACDNQNFNQPYLASKPNCSLTKKKHLRAGYITENIYLPYF